MTALHWDRGLGPLPLSVFQDGKYSGRHRALLYVVLPPVFLLLFLDKVTRYVCHHGLLVIS